MSADLFYQLPRLSVLTPVSRLRLIQWLMLPRPPNAVCAQSAFKQNPWFLTDFPLDEARCADWTFLPIHPGRKSQKYSDLLIQRQFRICAPILLLSQ